MEIKMKTRGEIYALAALKRARTGRNKVKVYIPSPYLPDFPVYRRVKDETAYGPVEVYVRPSQDAGWEIFVRFKETFTNPALPPEVAEKVKK